MLAENYFYSATRHEKPMARIAAAVVTLVRDWGPLTKLLLPILEHLETINFTFDSLIKSSCFLL